MIQKKEKLKNVCIRITKGTTPTTYGYSFVENGINYIKAESITEEGRILPNTFAFIDEATNVYLKRSILREKDILISIAGAKLGKCGFLTEEYLPANTNQAVGIVRVNPEYAEPKFVFYNFVNKHTYKVINSLNSQAAQPNLNLGQLGELEFKFPSLNNQRKIASILSTYDDLIENNLKRMKLLEEAIRTHYKILMSQNKGNWEKLRLENAYDFCNGFAFYKEGYSEEGKIVVDLGNISEDSNFIMTGKEKYVSELLYEDKKKFQLNKYDVVVAMTDMTSRLGILAKVGVIDESNKYILNQRVGRLRTNIEYIDHCFLYASLSNDEFRNEMKTKAKGAVQIYFNTKDILEYEVTIPPKKLVEDFRYVINPIIDLRIILNNQNTKLREARDILLPRLMSGEIEV